MGFFHQPQKKTLTTPMTLPAAKTKPQTKFTHAILGGTFDRFHAGHRHFLDKAIENSDYLTIGITTPSLFEHKPQANRIEPYEIRKNRVEKYLAEQGFEGRFEIIPLVDIFGNALTDTNIDAIFTTHQSIKNVDKINYERQMRGLAPLDVVFVEPLKDARGIIISSSRIRAGEIDVNGNQIINNI